MDDHLSRAREKVCLDLRRLASIVWQTFHSLASALLVSNLELLYRIRAKVAAARVQVKQGLCDRFAVPVTYPLPESGHSQNINKQPDLHSSRQYERPDHTFIVEHHSH